jgi:hypothetical protein
LAYIGIAAIQEQVIECFIEAQAIERSQQETDHILKRRKINSDESLPMGVSIITKLIAIASEMELPLMDTDKMIQSITSLETVLKICGSSKFKTLEQKISSWFRSLGTYFKDPRVSHTFFFIFFLNLPFFLCSRLMPNLSKSIKQCWEC